MNIDELAEEYFAVMSGFGYKSDEITSADEMYTKLDKEHEGLMLSSSRKKVDHEIMKIETVLGYLVAFMVRWDLAGE